MTKCVECGGVVERKTNQKYQYVESGLKNVWLGGLTVYQCKSCHAQFPEIPGVDRLHALIADAITEKRFALAGPEFRFLRKQMRMKAKDLAVFLGVTLTTISRWETGAEKIGTANDRLMRSFYMFWRLKQGEVVDPSRILERVRTQFEGISPRQRSQQINVPGICEYAGVSD